jgi:hypothetical protein
MSSSYNNQRTISLVPSIPGSRNLVLSLPETTLTGNVWSEDYTQIRIPPTSGAQARMSWTTMTCAEPYFIRISQNSVLNANVRLLIYEGATTSSQPGAPVPNGPLLCAFAGGSASSFYFSARPGQTITFCATITNAGLAAEEVFEVRRSPAIYMSKTFPSQGQLAYYTDNKAEYGTFWARATVAESPARADTPYALASYPGGVNIQIFTSNGTWSNPFPLTTCISRVFLVGGGQGGGNGGTGATNATGGTGGNPGAVIFYTTFNFTGATNTTAAVTVGAGGLGTAGTALSNQTSVRGTSGGNSSFSLANQGIDPAGSNTLRALGGTTAGATGGDIGPPGSGYVYPAGATSPAETLTTPFTATAGSNGGNLTAGAAVAPTGAAFVPFFDENLSIAYSSTATNSTGKSGSMFWNGYRGYINPPAATTPSITFSGSLVYGMDGGAGVGSGGVLPFGGSGGGGGSLSSDLTYAGKGGNGGLYGGGGGGGAAAPNGVTSGSGGDGASGVVVVISW